MQAKIAHSLALALVICALSAHAASVLLQQGTVIDCIVTLDYDYYEETAGAVLESKFKTDAGTAGNCKTLSISLKKNKLTDAHLPSIAKAFKQNIGKYTALETLSLDLSRNIIKNADANLGDLFKTLLDSLKTTETLRLKFDLSNNPLMAEAFSVFTQSLTNSGLTAQIEVLHFLQVNAGLSKDSATTIQSTLLGGLGSKLLTASIDLELQDNIFEAPETSLLLKTMATFRLKSKDAVKIRNRLQISSPTTKIFQSTLLVAMDAAVAENHDCLTAHVMLDKKELGFGVSSIHNLQKKVKGLETNKNNCVSIIFTY
jgi:hypothetical protein